MSLARIGKFIGVLFGLYFLGAAASAQAAYLFDASNAVRATYGEIPSGASLATGDINKDGTPEIIAGSPPGMAPTVWIYTKDGTLIRSFGVFSAGMTAGINVAAGDCATKNNMEIIVAPRRGAPPLVGRYSPTGKQLAPPFYAYVPGFTGGVNLATGDTNGDGKDEIIVGPGPGGGSHVRWFNYAGKNLGNLTPANIYPYEDFRGGLVVGSIDYNNDGKWDIVVAPQSNNYADVKIYNARNRNIFTYFRAFGGYRGGVSMSLNPSGGGKRVVLGAAAGGGPHVLQYNLTTGKPDGMSVFPYTYDWRGGVTVAFVEYSGKVRFAASAGSTFLSAQQLASFGSAVPMALRHLTPTYEQKIVMTAVGGFSSRIARISLQQPNLKVLSLTASSTTNCNNHPCGVQPLATYVSQVRGFAGINGSYFCPADYASCAAYPGSFYWMWYNAQTRVMSNAYQNQFNQGPVIAIDASNRLHYYRIAKDWPGQAAFEKSYGTLRAAISNGPELVYDSKLVVSASGLDTKQRTVKSNRSAIGIKGTDIYLVAVSGATVIDIGHVMLSLGMEKAMNLDGGGSTALWFNGQYRIGPGRNIPNALTFTVQ